MLRTLTLFFLGILLSGLSQQVIAQQQDPENSLLPEIDPQDIEIRSQFKARFPGIRRQPILGFDPTPRLYRVDPNRQPFMETQEQVVANLPVSELSRPAPPQYQPLEYSPDIGAFSRLGFGSYTSPEAQFWGIQRIDEKSYVGGDLDFSSSNGHLDDQPSSFRFFNANAEYATKLDERTNFHLTGGAQSDFHYLYDLNDPSVTPAELGKNYLGFHLDVDLQRHKNTVEGWNIQADVRYFDVTPEEEVLAGDVNETVYHGAFSKRWAGKRINETFALQTGVKSGVYGPIENQDGWTTLKLGSEYQRLYDYRTELTGAANIFYITDVAGNAVYPGATLKIEHTFNENMKIIARAKGRPYLKTLEQHHEFNRFLTGNNLLRHSYQIDIAGELRYEYFRGSTLSAGAKYTDTSNDAYYTRRDSSTGPNQSVKAYYQINYRNTINSKVYVGSTHQLLPERFWISGRIYLQNPEFNNGTQVPFRETWGINSSISFRPIDRITIEGWADYLGPRKTSVSGEELGSVLLVGSQIDVELTKGIGAYLKGVNLLDQNYQIWKEYTERPFQIYGGVTVKLN